jgi:hypothetical protein
MARVSKIPRPTSAGSEVCDPAIQPFIKKYTRIKFCFVLFKVTSLQTFSGMFHSSIMQDFWRHPSNKEEDGRRPLIS